MNANKTDDELKSHAPKRQQAPTSDITSTSTLKHARTTEDTTPKTSPVNTEPSPPLLFPPQSKGGHDEEKNRPRGGSKEQPQEAVAAGLNTSDFEVNSDDSQGVEMPESPAALLMWNADNVISAVVHLNNAAAANANAMAPGWLGGGAFPITSNGFMQAIATRVGAQSSGVIGNALIATNSYQQYANVKTLMCLLGLDPLVSTLPAKVLPLARNFSIMRNSNAQTTGSPDPVLAPPAPGVTAIL